MRYSDLVGDWLVEEGYTTCFFVAGGNVMHALDSFRHRFAMRPTVHEVCAGIATEYFNEISVAGKAFALVTAGPGVTNIVTALAGAYLESRELLVIGGQVKTDDLSRGRLRQRGIQEIDGVGLTASVTLESRLLESPVSKSEWQRLISLTRCGRRGPVFIEWPLDVQAKQVQRDDWDCGSFQQPTMPRVTEVELQAIVRELRDAQRPIILLGGGVSRATAGSLQDELLKLGIPILTTWNGADRLPERHALYFGRPNTWGQRSANLIVQQCDLLLVLGSRLGLQQTGFNWREFAAGARVIQVDLDVAELHKGHPHVHRHVEADANDVLERLCRIANTPRNDWLDYCREIRDALPLIEPVNHTHHDFISPYVFVSELSDLCRDDDLIIPCSSGSAFTVAKQAFRIKEGQYMVTNKGLAAMGYGLGGAIGAALAYPLRRTILLEGDGGFAQNLQEVGTAKVNKLNLKMFIFDDGGYASIRMTQRNYFNGGYVGCDTSTGLGIPQWRHIFDAYDVPSLSIASGFAQDKNFDRLFNASGVAAFLIRIDPDQTYFPKITSRVTPDGNMESEPLHRMSPALGPDLIARFGKYLPGTS